MQVHNITSKLTYNSFRGKFEPSEDLNKLISSASENDLMEFSLMLDVINGTKDENLFFIKEKKPTALSPDKGFILWCQEHWDAFPKAYKNFIVDDVNNTKEIAKALGCFTGILKAVYNVNFDKDIKRHFQKQIASKLMK